MSTDGAPRALPSLSVAHDALATTVDALGPADLTRPSRAAGWSVAQVLSHLGSGAEICTALLRRGIAGDEQGPVRDELTATWARWDAMDPATQAAAWHEAEQTHLALLDDLSREQLSTVQVPYFVGPLGVEEYAGYRLSEAVLHAWDVQAALDPAVGLLPAAVPVLLARVDLVASRFRDADVLASLAPAQVAIHLTDPLPGAPREHVLDLREELHLWPCAGERPDGELRTSSEALLRLVYGRHPEPLVVGGRVDADRLRALFPGF